MKLRRLARAILAWPICVVLFLLLSTCKCEGSPVDSALPYRATLIREAQAVHGVGAPIPMFAGQIRQESSWRPGITAPAAGQYLVSATIGLSGTTWAAGNLVQIVIKKNGSTYKIGTTMLQASGTGNLIVATATSLVDLAANDTVSIAAFHNGTGSATTSASLGATGNHLSIVRIP